MLNTNLRNITKAQLTWNIADLESCIGLTAHPILATLSLFYAVGRWNAYADNMYFTRSAELKMIQYKLYQLVASATEAQNASLADTGGIAQATPEVLQAACIMFVTVPIIIIYPFLQKYFVQGTMIGAVKG